MARPAETPRSPVRVVAPVLVTVDDPKTEKVAKLEPRIPSAFALGTTKEKIAKQKISEEKIKNRPISRIFENLCTAQDGPETRNEAVQLKTACILCEYYNLIFILLFCGGKDDVDGRGDLRHLAGGRERSGSWVNAEHHDVV